MCVLVLQWRCFLSPKTPFPRRNTRGGFSSFKREPGKFTVAIFGREQRQDRGGEAEVEKPGGASEVEVGEI